MHVIKARNINDAYEKGIELIKNEAYVQQSRNGGVKVMDGPVTTVYDNPRQRCLFEPIRDVNPFFHLFESLWMLAGRNDVAYLDFLNKNMKNYSDDGKTFHGAYGHRWVNHFRRDQLEELIELLQYKPLTRRGILQMWDCTTDLNRDESGKDIPCNIVAKFEINNNLALDMVVFNRSNDMIFGAYGANAVHFSILQEYIANRLGVKVGRYWQISSNFHAYDKAWDEKCAGTILQHQDLYRGDMVVPYAHIFMPGQSVPEFFTELDGLLDLPQEPDGSGYNFRTPFFQDVCAPMWRTWCLWKKGDKLKAIAEAKTMYSGVDWSIAVKRWMQRRII